MQSDGRLVKGMCGLQSLEWKEDHVLNFLNWDELPEAPLHGLIAGLTLDSYPYVNPRRQQPQRMDGR